MRKILLLALLLPVFATGQTQEQNYIKTTTYKVAVTESVESPADTVAGISITYFDGLGRPIQQIGGKQAGDGTDIITHTEYDAFGRQVREYLPYAADQGLGFDAAAKANTMDFYTGTYTQTTTNPYSEKVFEASPLNRVLKQGAPGNTWAVDTLGGDDHTIKFVYSANDSLEVKLYAVGTTYSATSKLYEPELSDGGYYGKGQLYKTITKDENWSSGHDNTTEEFKDKQGRVVLKRTYGVSVVDGESDDVAHDTYYIYDDYGNLTYVIPPKVDTGATITTGILANLCYQYKYDARNRLASKQQPGKQREYIVYDKLDRAVMTGPALNPFDGGNTGWLFTKYETFGRVAYTGWTAADLGEGKRQEFQDDFDGEEHLFEARTAMDAASGDPLVDLPYTNIAIPYSGYNVLTINYYDNYNGLHTSSGDFTTEAAGQDIGFNNTTRKPRGLPTGSWVRALTDDSHADYGYTKTFYDARARPIRNYKQNWLGGHTISDTNRDFTKTLYTITAHRRTAGDDDLIIREDFKYTPQDRVLAHTHKIKDMDPELLAHNAYDVLGQLVTKEVGGEDLEDFTGLQSVKYAYNIRGWLTGINNADDLGDGSLFAFRVNYDSVDDDLGGQVKALYNGNISETYWRTSSDDVQRKYGYAYDAMNRMTNSWYQKPEQSVALTDSYDESLSYDKNGNIAALQRNGAYDDNGGAYLQIDDLAYAYDDQSNRLTKVSDGTNDPNGFMDGTNTEDDYTYDDNGNLASDANKGITAISYNHLDQPIEITFPAGNYIHYIYDANGEKLRKTVHDSLDVANTDYLEGFQYVRDTLRLFPHAEGYVNVLRKSEVVNYNYVFNYTDHLGNIRLSYGYDPTDHVLKVMQENNYYPFGLRHVNYNMSYKDYASSRDNGVIIDPPCTGCPAYYKYKYNGKEWQDELGLNDYDYGARNYDPAIGRWMNMDPLAEESRRWSPYTYAMDNPVFFIDRDGMTAGKLSDIVYLETPGEGPGPGHGWPSWNSIKKQFSNFASTVSKAYHSSKLSSDMSNAYTNTGLRQAVHSVSSSLDNMFTPAGPQRLEKTSNENLSATFTSKNGGGENPKTRGNAGENIDGDAALTAAAATGPPGAGNTYKNFKAGVEFVHNTGELGEKGIDAFEAIKLVTAQTKQYMRTNRIGENGSGAEAETKEVLSEDTIVPLSDINKVNNLNAMRRNTIETQN